MPILPQPIDINRNKQFNKNRVLTLDVFNELLHLSNEERPRVINASLTSKQKAQFETFREDPERLRIKFPKLPHLRSLHANYYQSTKPNLIAPKSKRRKRAIHTVKYDVVGQTLEINNEPIILSGAKFQAAVCFMVFNHPLMFRGMMTYREILNHGVLGQELRQRDITEKEQLRTAKSDLNKKVKAITDNDDFLVGRGGVQISPRFRKITS